MLSIISKILSSFFPLTVIEWKNLDSNIRNIRDPSTNSTFHYHNRKGLKLLQGGEKYGGRGGRMISNIFICLVKM